MTRKSPVIAEQLPTSEERHVRDLQQRLAEAEATIQALLSGQIDAVVDATHGTPVLLAKAQEAREACYPSSTARNAWEGPEAADPKIAEVGFVLSGPLYAESGRNWHTHHVRPGNAPTNGPGAA